MAKKKDAAKDKKSKTKGGPEATLKQTVDDIQKEFGQGSIMRLGDDQTVAVEAISTGSLRQVRISTYAPDHQPRMQSSRNWNRASISRSSMDPSAGRITNGGGSSC